MKYGDLIVIEAVGYGLSAAKEKTSIACTFSSWNTCARRLYSTKQTASVCLQRSPNAERRQPGGKSGKTERILERVG